MECPADVINVLIRHNGYKSYLELGVQFGNTFNVVECARKFGVDAEFEGWGFLGTTDDFFAQSTETWDIVFIDACHHHDAVLRDFDNALARLNPGGSIVMHDCNPCDLRHEQPNGCGTVWRAFVKIRERGDIDACVCNFHHGTTIVQRGQNTHLLYIEKTMDELDFNDLAQHRQEWLDPQPPDAVVCWIKKSHASL